MVPQMARGSARGTRWVAQRGRVLDRDGWRCSYCGIDLVGEDATVDHVSPIAHDPERNYNDSDLVAACRTCNGRKSDSISRRIDFANTRWLPNGLPK